MTGQLTAGNGIADYIGCRINSRKQMTDNWQLITEKENIYSRLHAVSHKQTKTDNRQRIQ